MTRKMITANVPISALKLHKCAWKGCPATTPVNDLPLPNFWRWLALYAGPPGVHPLASRQLDRDAVLCPEHAQMLHLDLLEDIGQRLDHPKGRA